MAIPLDEFYKEFFQDVLSVADADGQYREDAFFDQFCDQLVEAGELDSADRAAYVRPSGGLRVDGYGGDPRESEGVLSLIVLDFNQSPEIVRLTGTEMEAIFKRVSNFMAKALDTRFRNGLEESSPAFGLSDMIAKRWANVSKIRLFLLSNRQLSAKVDGREAEKFEGKSVTYSVWDIDRLYRFVTAGHGREEILIDLTKDYGGAIPLLAAHQPEADYEAYLAVIPGSQLAAIYDKWGARLLEQNVRVFLQARGSINKGIRNTIENDPAMFFAYNNGLTATAEEITTERAESGLLLTGLRNLQIVNGGQTTASIHAAYRKKVDLSKVFIQVKLSLVPPERAIDVVPKISEYANSQNKVNAADFFANHPFHVRMEDFSRRIFAPSPDGTFRESKWFYERARGQYQDARGTLTLAQQKKFDLEYPKAQLFSKTDLAKFLNLWRGHPDVVSRGAQKNFVHFANDIGKEWVKQPDDFNEDFYRHAVAKAIAFRTAEKLVTEQPWYEGGYRANIVAYAIAKLAHDVATSGLSVDFNAIWKKQRVADAMGRALKVVAAEVRKVITDPLSGISNVTEWAKQQACWARVMSLKIDWPAEWLDELIGKAEMTAQKQSAVKDQRVLNGIEAQTMVVNAGGKFWREVIGWAQSRDLLSPKESGILHTAAGIPTKIPSELQSIKTIEILRQLHAEGCQIGREYTH
ncbi:MAG: AIPR family protein [Polaromonas sp.]